ncbi:MAG: gamma-glutamyltransferase [Desulfurococcaceae archaeon]
MPVKIAIGQKGVTSDHPLATKAGIEILENGGNAFDAAIAVSAVLSIVQPHMGGPGGDAYLLGFVGEEVVVLASAGRSPSGFSVEEFIGKSPLRGPLTVTTPGLAHLWGHIYEEYATLPLEVLLKPAISLAYNGFHAGWLLGRVCEIYEKELELYKWSQYYKGVRTGDRVVNREAASALRLIATRGYEEFYYGDLAERIVSELQDQGVNVGLDDFMEHESLRVSPLKLELSDKVLYEIPPNTQGLSTLQIISALYELDIYKEDFNSPSRITKWSEPVAKVYLFRDLFLGDPNYMNIDPQAYVKYSSVETALKSTYVDVGGLQKSQSDTTFFIVSDGESIIGFIQSLFYPFGSGLMAGGFPVQNRAIGFARRRDVPNSPAPQKLPLQTLSILAVDADDRKYIIGCVGGDYRPQLHLRAYENLFVYNQPPARAVELPRFIYTKFYGDQEVVVEEPLKPPQNPCNARIRAVDYFSAPGHIHIGVLYENRVELVNDPRSEGITIAI